MQTEPRREEARMAAAMAKYTKPERTPRGSAHGIAKLTEADIIYIRAVFDPFSENFRAADLAIKFGVCIATIRHILQRRTWRHVQ